MYNFTKLILTSAVFVTSGFATTIDSQIKINSGKVTALNSAKVCAPSGEIVLMGSDTNETTLEILQHRVIELNGGKLFYEGQNVINPNIILNGVLRLTIGKDDLNSAVYYPILDLPNVTINGNWRKNTNQDTTDYIEFSETLTSRDNITITKGNDNNFYINDKINPYFYQIISSYQNQETGKEYLAELMIEGLTYQHNYTINSAEIPSITINNENIMLNLNDNSNGNVFKGQFNINDGQNKTLNIYLHKNGDKFDVHFVDHARLLVMGGVLDMMRLRELPKNTEDILSGIESLKASMELSEKIELDKPPTIWADRVAF